MDNLIIAGILLLIKAMIFCIVNILEVLLEDIGILKSLFLHNAITIISSSVLYFLLSYYIINPRISASIIFDDCFSIFMLSSYTVCDDILITRILNKQMILEFHPIRTIIKLLQHFPVKSSPNAHTK